MKQPPPPWHEMPLRVHSRPAESSPPDTVLARAAALMQLTGSTALIIREGKKLKGILTDKDLRRATAAGAHPETTPVSRWMSAPVRTFPEDIGMGAAQIAMLQHRINHLVLTPDGAPDSPVTGVVSQRDILITQSHSPALLLREIRQAGSAEALRKPVTSLQQLTGEYLNQALPLPYAMEIATALKDAVITRLVELAQETCPVPEVPFAWMALGSLGRGEQLLPTDQDNALVFGKVPESDLETTRSAFLALARQVNQGLESLGYAPCPAGMMAGNPRWCCTPKEWEGYFDQWIGQPDEDSILLSSVFLDLRYVCGSRELVSGIQEHLRGMLPEASLFQAYLGVSALQAPPAFGLWGQLKREGRGPHQGRFDLKARGLMPLVDAARLLTLSRGQFELKNTAARYRYLAHEEPQNADLYARCREAFLFLHGLRTRTGLQKANSGRYLRPALMPQKERKKLTRHLRVLKPLGQVLEQRFRLSGMR
ncbi:DUF294 nucleotidyltransferase-like domain-containing protein [Robiginitalea sp. M366]|uniref:DUF294 nucleotidyltransferase-like domain-containing protein n=1 Tax=Robiginitalea aestuariiviva TaxID=3036903 RepID=UPI00240E2571|nr:DUF294 nucleotidyltransferase-like domain-containing protein [Robiginitalea aestuariiviva]MDG1572666.1 DUF294 nucleotidyltransferase-like domain-containing protein [Robiginitalea aestuariiviva]